MKSPTLVLCSFFLSTALSICGHVTSWRNGGNGVYTDIDVPFDWSNKSPVVWKQKTPVWGNACPILVGDKLFYTAEPAQLICADALTGKTLWQSSNSFEDVIEMTPKEQKEIRRILAANEKLASRLEPIKRKVYQLNRRLRNDKSNTRLQDQLEKAKAQQRRLEAEAGEIPDMFQLPKTHDTNGYASMTSCSDGAFIYSCFGMGMVTKHDLNGNRIWGKVMEGPDHNFGTAVSPQLVGGNLIVRLGDYAALNPDTGEELWRVEDPATFGPPASFQVEDEWFLYTVRGELIRISDGKKLPSQDWTIPAKKFAFFNTPFVDGKRVYVVHGAAGIQGDLYCMEIPGTLQEMNRNGLELIWHSDVSQERYYASPLVYEGIVYIFSMGQRVQAIDADFGGVLYSHQVEGTKGRGFTGVLLVNDTLLVGEENGTLLFLEPGPQYNELHRFNLGENRSSPIFIGNRAYLRTINHLYAFGSEK